MKEGTAFDPAETVLLEKEDFKDREPPQVEKPVNAEVKVARYEPQRIELETRNERPGFLALSEVYYQGWEVLIDGRPAKVERANYALRGVAVPAGDHRIEFVFRSHSFRNGAAWSLLGVLLLIIGASGGAGLMLTKIEWKLEEPATRRILVMVGSKLSTLSRSRHRIETHNDCGGGRASELRLRTGEPRVLRGRWV